MQCTCIFYSLLANCKELGVAANPNRHTGTQCMNTSDIFPHLSLHRHLQHNITICNTTSISFFPEFSYKLQLFWRDVQLQSMIYRYFIWIQLLIVVIQFPHIEVSLQYFLSSHWVDSHLDIPHLGRLYKLTLWKREQFNIAAKKSWSVTSLWHPTSHWGTIIENVYLNVS